MKPMSEDFQLEEVQLESHHPGEDLDEHLIRLIDSA
jgi:hypothetical protein